MYNQKFIILHNSSQATDRTYVV